MLSARLSLAQWLSPAFPTGAFAASHGLETYIAQAEIRSGAAFEDWLRGVLEFGTGWQDAVLIAQALEPEADLTDLADIARALAPGGERLSESADQGAAFARTVSALIDQPIAPAPLPVAYAAAARDLNLPKHEVIALYLLAFAGNLTSVATRAVPLGQTEAQQRLAGLTPLILELASRAASASLADLGASALAGDIASLRHETLDVRLYRT